MMGLSLATTDNATGSIDNYTVGTYTLPGGYTCGGCGTFVAWGMSHVCPTTYPVVQPQTTYWSWPTYTFPVTWPQRPQISRYLGSVDTLDCLPSSAVYGDAYHVIEDDLLVVRDVGGWFHYDTATA